MAGTLNFIYLTVTVLILGAAVAVILYIVNKCSEFASTTKEKLKSKGYNITPQGVAVQTQKRFNHEDYVDATQRGLVKALGTSSFGNRNNDGSGSSSNRSKAHDANHTVKQSGNGLLHRRSL